MHERRVVKLLLIVALVAVLYGGRAGRAHLFSRKGSSRSRRASRRAPGGRAGRKGPRARARCRLSRPLHPSDVFHFISGNIKRQDVRYIRYRRDARRVAARRGAARGGTRRHGASRGIAGRRGASRGSTARYRRTAAQAARWLSRLKSRLSICSYCSPFLSPISSPPLPSPLSFPFPPPLTFPTPPSSPLADSSPTQGDGFERGTIRSHYYCTESLWREGYRHSRCRRQNLIRLVIYSTLERLLMLH